MRKSIRITTAALTAALAIGVAAPTASAVSQSAPRAAATQTISADQASRILSSAGVSGAAASEALTAGKAAPAGSESATRGRFNVRPFLKILKRYGSQGYNAVKKAVKKGYAEFTRVLKQVVGNVQYWVIKNLYNLRNVFEALVDMWY